MIEKGEKKMVTQKFETEEEATKVFNKMQAPACLIVSRGNYYVENTSSPFLRTYEHLLAIKKLY